MIFFDKHFYKLLIMNAIEIKEKRKKLGLTQKQLAELLGVSYQTVNGYENGKEIPATKIQLLENILNPAVENFVNENMVSEYQVKTGFDTKIEQINDRIFHHEEIIKMSKDENLIKHHNELIKLLKIQIELIMEQKLQFLKENK